MAWIRTFEEKEARGQVNDANLADALMDDYRTAPVDPDMMQLLSFAEKVARDASQITADDISNLQSVGFSDRAVLDATHIAGFFCYMNRVVQALGADGKSSVTRGVRRKNSLRRHFTCSPESLTEPRSHFRQGFLKMEAVKLYGTVLMENQFDPGG